MAIYLSARNGTESGRDGGEDEDEDVYGRMDRWMDRVVDIQFRPYAIPSLFYSILSSPLLNNKEKDKKGKK